MISRFTHGLAASVLASPCARRKNICLERIFSRQQQLSHQRSMWMASKMAAAIVQGEQLKLSRPRKNAFLEALSNYMGEVMK